MTERNAGRVPMTVGSLSEMSGVSVRTLHHYDEIGLLRPTSRSAAGYRLYTPDDAERLRLAELNLAAAIADRRERPGWRCCALSEN